MVTKKDRAPESQSKMEVCAGCDTEAPEHPYIGVMNKKDDEGHVATITSDRNPDWVGVPVCEPCWRDPAHRKFPLKCHFHPRATARAGVILAGSADVGM
jgi:hypothetical protein